MFVLHVLQSNSFQEDRDFYFGEEDPSHYEVCQQSKEDNSCNLQLASVLNGLVDINLGGRYQPSRR